jgi:diguanylate cyclase (GGDEF)-like protein/PAS domain S-box-containing protein
MSVAVSSQDLLPDQIADLESRLRKLAEDKSNLQLVIRLIERINPLPGVEDMIRSLLASIVETIGGTNIKLYYWIGSELHCTDFAGDNVVLAEIDDPVAARVARSRSFIEERGDDADTLLTKEQVAPGAWIWAFPLIVGADLVGIVKIENLHISGASLRTVLPIFFSHAALILSNEIRNFTRQKAEQALANSEANIRLLLKKVPIALSHTSTNFDVLETNDRFVELFGYTLEDVPTLDDWWPCAYPDPVYRQELKVAWDKAVAKAMQEGTDLPPVEIRVTCKNGEERVVEVSTVMVADGAVTAFVDLTERKRAEEIQRRLNRELGAVTDCTQALMRAEDEQALLDDICHIICEEAGYRMAWVGYAEHDDTLTLRPHAWAGEEAGYLLQTSLTWADTPAGHRPFGVAVRTGKTSYVQDFSATAWSDSWTAQALQRGYRSGIALPLKNDKSATFGALCIYSAQADSFTSDEIKLLEELARDLAFGITSLRLRAKQDEAMQQLAASEQLFRALVENSPEPIARYDRELRRIYVNPAIRKLFKEPIEQVLRETPASASPLVDPDSYMAAIRHVIETAKEQTHEGAYRTPDGEVRWSSWRFTPEFDADGKVATVLVISHDITERKHSEDSLRLAASVFATSQEGILISDAQNRIIDVNPAFTQLTGYRRDEALGRNPSFLSARRQGEGFYELMWQAIEAKGEWQGELWNRRKNGGVYAELISIIAVKDDDGQLQHYVGAFSDISVLKEHEADLDRIAHYDVLTAVPNRRLLGDRLDQAIARARRLGKNLAVCYLDLDGFKAINDQFGHQGGDLLLVEIARRLLAMSRADDTVARLGGDEFVLLWNDIDAEADCLQALDRILIEVSAPTVIDGVEVSVSASIGVTLYPEDNVDADSLLRHADHAMYSAKQMGKNRYQMFDSRLERQLSSRTDLLAKVTRALVTGQLELYYQPKVDCSSGTIIGAEALIRWNDPILGLVGPNEFLPLIESDNLAVSVGRWVFEQAVQQARDWDSIGLAVPISVNVFPRHLSYPSFIDDLRDTIARCWPEMPAKRLLLEIVETSELEELDAIEGVIKECLSLGIGFSLDDFGTGYSSLVYLRRLSVEELKIDQSFVRDMLNNPDDHAIVVSVIGLGQAFGLRVVAEGVESNLQARHLVKLGCHVVQGYGLGRPMPARDFHHWHQEFSLHGGHICR